MLLVSNFSFNKKFDCQKILELLLINDLLLLLRIIDLKTITD